MLFASSSLLGQTTDNQKHNLDVSADFVSRYLWRGELLDDSPNVQPAVTYTSSKKNFEAQIWGSANFISNFSEVGLQLKYMYKYFGIKIYDGFVLTPASKNRNYFSYDASNTNHCVEARLLLGNFKKIPLSFSAGVYFFGNDKDANNDNLYSTYLEAQYKLRIGNQDFYAILGGTPAKSYYADEAAIINAGISVTKDIKITDNFSLPINAKISANPYKKDVFFVFGFSI